MVLQCYDCYISDRNNCFILPLIKKKTFYVIINTCVLIFKDNTLLSLKFYFVVLAGILHPSNFLSTILR